MAELRILVTGAAGYIGSMLCRQLLARGHHVLGVDVLLFGGEALLEVFAHSRFQFHRADVCDQAAMTTLLKEVDAVIHLAAIVGDPACKFYPEAATRLMDQGSRELYKAAQAAGAKHFVFASTCSNYGIMDGDTLLNEESPLQPQSHYARLKVGFEEHLINQGHADWTILRFSTAYGHSMRPRFDLTVNHFTRDLSLGRALHVFGADLWRPYCHVDDLAAAAVLSVEAGPDKVGRKVLNVGHSTHNYTKREIATEILHLVPDGQVAYAEGHGGDLRNYRVDFSRIHQVLGFEPQRTLANGIQELHRLMRSGLLSDPDHLAYRNSPL